MNYARILSLLLIAFFVSCLNEQKSVMVWKCRDSKLYLNKIDTCWLSQRGKSYDIYFSLRHRDDFNRDSLMFQVNINENIDTILLPLVDSNKCWLGKPYIGAYVMKILCKENVAFENDSVNISVMPLSSNVLEGIDWLAVEIESRNE